MNLSLEFNPVDKPQHARNKPKRGNHTKFSLKTRKTIIERDEGLCVKCKRPYHSIHHIIFASDLGSGTVDNGVCVCETCHTEAHKHRKVREWFERYKEKFLVGSRNAVESKQGLRPREERQWQESE